VLIDWFTVIAQVANFLILVWLMKRYLYSPILHAIDAREKRIADQLRDAETKKAEATKEQNEFQRKNQTLDANRDSMMKAAQDSADAERQKLLEMAHKESGALRAKLDAALQDERTALNREVATLVQQEVFDIARQALSDLANADVEMQMIKVFLDRLSALGQPEKDVLASALKAGPEPVLVRSAFALEAPQREAIQQALETGFGAGAAARFEVSPNLVCGIELGVNGKKLVWDVDDYLSSLDSRMSSLLTPVAAGQAA
jgi:F-type H+-transporting ATPase subunit b